MQNEIRLDTRVYPDGKKFQWFVLSDYNDHILAQGYAVTQKAAKRQSTLAANQIIYDLVGDI